MAELAQQDTDQRGLARALTNLRRPKQNLSDENGGTDAVEGDSLAEQEEQSQNFLRRRLDSLRGRAKNQDTENGSNVLQQQAEEKIKKEIAKKLSWRAFNMAMGASVILVFVTIIVWTVQFIGGNMMGSKMIPKLGLGETILWIIGLIVIAAIFSTIMLAITIMVEIFENPGRLISNILNIFWKNFWSGLLGG